MGLESKQTTALMSRSKKKSLDCVSLGDSLKLGLSSKRNFSILRKNNHCFRSTNSASVISSESFIFFLWKRQTQKENKIFWALIASYRTCYCSKSFKFFERVREKLTNLLNLAFFFLLLNYNLNNRQSCGWWKKKGANLLHQNR